MRAVIVSLMVLVLAASASATGLSVVVSPSTIPSGEPCTQVTITLCNLVANTAYAVGGSIVDGSGNVVGSAPVHTVMSDGKGKISEAYCLALAAGSYRVIGAASTSTQTLCGSAELTVTP